MVSYFFKYWQLMTYPRVTEIIKPFTNYDKIPFTILNRAAERGTSVHAICAALAKGLWLPDSMIDEEYKGYISSFKKWSEEQVEKFLIIEKRYVDDTLEYSGQLDFVVECKNKDIYLVDIKTSSSPQKTYSIQMAAYKRLLEIHDVQIKGAMLIYLNKDGDFPKIHMINDFTEETLVFISALRCYNYFNRSKSNGRADDLTESISKNTKRNGRARLYPKKRKKSQQSI
jgi:hypothetical protein